jgi:hypothetical protein
MTHPWSVEVEGGEVGRFCSRKFAERVAELVKDDAHVVWSAVEED